MSKLTKMWRIEEAPQYEIELTPGAWVLWGHCCNDEEYPCCGGTNSKILGTCGFAEGEGTKPADPEMISKITGLNKWTPERIQQPAGLRAGIERHGRRYVDEHYLRENKLQIQQGKQPYTETNDMP